LNKAAEGSSFLSLIQNNLGFIGLLTSSDEGLRLELLGDAIILFISVLMKGFLKLHHLFYGKPEVAASEESGENQNDLENPKKKSKPKKGLLEQKRKNAERKQLRQIYEKYLIADALKDWLKIKLVLKIVSYLFWYLAFGYVVLLSVFFRVSVGFLVALTIYGYYYSKLARIAMEYLEKINIVSKLDNCNGVILNLINWIFNRF